MAAAGGPGARRPACASGPADVRPRPIVAAVIDVGSNSVLLSTVAIDAAGRARSRDAWLATTRLGTGLRDGARLDPAAAERTCAAVLAGVERARRAGAARVWALATAAVRRAADGDAFARALEAASGVPVEVVPGDREAALAHAAVVHGLSASGPLLVADVGGGSTEVTLGGVEAAAGSASLPLGALTLTERHLRAAGDRREALARLRAAVEAILAGTPLLARAAAAGAMLAASGGTPTALATLDLGLVAYDPRRVHGHVLTRQTLGSLVDRLSPETGALPGIDPERAAILPAGAIVLAGIAVAGGAPVVRVSDHGVRHAYLRERLAAEGIGADFTELWG